MKYFKLTFGVTFLCLNACTNLTTIPIGGCGSGAAEQICLGQQEIPEKQVALFKRSSSEAVDAVTSPLFLFELDQFISKHSKTGEHSQAWEGIQPKLTQDNLVSEINGLKVETYGGIYGGFYALVFGNIAFDGSENGPIRLNRWALPRSSASIANTIVHEASHRIGLSHPSSNKSRKLCEPPYVIGSIIEKIILGESFNSANHCNLMD